MRKSIKNKLILLFGVTLVVVVGCGMLLNTIFLEDYYVFKNKALLDRVAIQVEAASVSEDPRKALGEIDRAEHLTIILLNEALEQETISYAIDTRELSPEDEAIKDLIRNCTDDLKEQPLYMIRDQESDAARLTYIAQMTNGDYMVLSRPLKLIRESVAIANEFYVLAGLCGMFIGSLLTYTFSKKFTKPIIEMSTLTEHMAALQFDETIRVETEDEIGSLATSINMLSSKLKVTIEDLQKEIAFQKVLSRDMSHELKTPIAVIKGYAEGIQYGVADNKEMLANYLNVITEECNRMDKLVKEMLTLSRLTATQYTLTQVAWFPAERLQEMLNQRFLPLMNKKGIALEWKVETNEMLADFDWLVQALSNLVSNAIKYGDGERIVITLEENLKDQVIQVFNTGGGIPEDKCEDVFHTFYRLDQARSRKQGGHGLGLAIVKSIVVLHKGTIQVINEKGGVTFKMILPRI